MNTIFPKTATINHLIHSTDTRPVKKPRLVNSAEIHPNLIPSTQSLQTTQQQLRYTLKQLKTPNNSPQSINSRDGNQEKTVYSEAFELIHPQAGTLFSSAKKISPFKQQQREVSFYPIETTLLPSVGLKQNLELSKKAIAYVESLRMLSANRPAQAKKLYAIKENNPDYYLQLKNIFHTFHSACSRATSDTDLLEIFDRLAIMLEKRKDNFSAGLSFEKCALASSYLRQYSPNLHIDFVALDEFSTEQFMHLIEQSNQVDVVYNYDTNQLEIISKAAITLDTKTHDQLFDTHTPEHYMLVLGRDPETTELNQPSTWTDDMIVCDPWAKQTYPIFQLEEHMQLLNSQTLGQTQLRVIHSFTSIHN